MSVPAKHYNVPWQEDSCKYAVPRSDMFTKDCLAAVCALGASEVAVRFTVNAPRTYADLRKVGSRKIFQILFAALGCEDFEFQFDKMGVVVTLTGQMFAALALKLMELRQFGEVSVTAQPMLQRFTKRILVYDVDEDFTAREVAETLQIRGGTFTICEAFRQQFRTNRNEGTLSAFKGFGMFVTYIGPAFPEKVFLCRRSMKFRSLIPRPLQCEHCLRYGHSKRFCRQKSPRCAECAGGHSTEHHADILTQLEITNRSRDPSDRVEAPPTRCVHCDHDGRADAAHAATDPSCPVHRDEQEIQEEAYVKCLSRKEAVLRRGRLQKVGTFATALAGERFQPQRIDRVEENVRQQRDLISEILKKLKGLQQASQSDDNESTGSAETVTDVEMPERRATKKPIDEPHQERHGSSRPKRRK